MAYCPQGCGLQSIIYTTTSTSTAPLMQQQTRELCPICKSPLIFSNGFMKGCLNGHTFLNPACDFPRIVRLEPETEASPPVFSFYTEPTLEELTYCIAQDRKDTVERAIFVSRAEAWDYASHLLYSYPLVRRIIFYDSAFIFVDALSRTGYQKENVIEVLSRKDKKALLALKEK